MRITQLTHASMLVEAGDVRIVTDPWWQGPCFGAQWWNYPRPYLDPIREGNLDYIYVSHGHNDHFHPGTLKTLPRSATVLVSKNIDIGRFIEELGFKVIELSDDETYDVSDDVKVRIVETVSEDTFLVVSDGKETCINLNDALHATPVAIQDKFCDYIEQQFGRPDYVFCGYGVASHFPNCYRLPGKDYAATAAERQKYFNRQWVRIIHKLEPRFGFPFAADVALLEDDLIWSLEPLHNAERPTDAFEKLYPESATRVVDIAPGFTISEGAVEKPVIHRPVNLSDVKAEYAEEIVRANRYGPVRSDAVEELVTLLRNNAQQCAAFLKSFPGDYRCLIQLRNSEDGIAVSKTGAEISIARAAVGDDVASKYDLTFTTRSAYLRWSLTKRFGHEILFVGSGGIFEYFDRQRIRQNIHSEIRVLVQRQDQALPARPKAQPRLIAAAKKLVKSMLGIRETDLYDLEEWTVFK